MAPKLFAFTCGTVTGEFAHLMEGGEGDITVPIPVYLIEHEKGRALFDINKIPLEKALDFEWQGTLEDARIKAIPLLHLAIADFSALEIGALLAFWQLFAVYSSVLREVDPFDQPQVENSKNISFHKRLGFKGLL